jgi:hypothetical protein
VEVAMVALRMGDDSRGLAAMLSLIKARNEKQHRDRRRDHVRRHGRREDAGNLRGVKAQLPERGMRHARNE